jgi:1,4-dihydroxy-2-naphthoate polyprenyltransferase
MAKTRSERMKATAFLSLVEIKTKTASVIPFLTGTLFALYRHGSLRLLPMFLFLFSMLCFDMFTTGLNNRQDHRRARKREGYNYETHNAIVRHALSPLTVDLTLAALFLLAAAAGLVLVCVTDWLVLAIGVLAFLAGMLYSAGPMPISRTPLGEAASGLAMGLGITFLAWWIHAPANTLFSGSLDWSALSLTLYVRPALDILLISMPSICCIANIMLANNLCDREDDLLNHRYTLPIVAGVGFAMWLHHALYALAMAAIVTAVLSGSAPWPCLLVLAVVPKVLSNLSAFRNVQSKKETFETSVMNFLLICLPFALLMGVGSL